MPRPLPIQPERGEGHGDRPPRIARLDAAGTIVSANAEWQARSAGDAPMTSGVGTNYLSACEQFASTGLPGAAEAVKLVRNALSGAVADHRMSYGVANEMDSGWFSLQAIALPGGDGALVVLEDDTWRHEVEDDLRYRAFHDPLTGLANRALLIDRLEHALRGAERGARSSAVLFIDLDDFKSVNDRLGHLAGDAALCEVAHRLGSCTRASDTVGRWGGDEFVIVAERLDDDITADVLASRVQEALLEPMPIAGEYLCIHASIGVAHRLDDETAVQVVEAADRALIATRARRRRPRVSRGNRRSSREVGVVFHGPPDG